MSRILPRPLLKSLVFCTVIPPVSSASAAEALGGFRPRERRVARVGSQRGAESEVLKPAEALQAARVDEVNLRVDAQRARHDRVEGPDLRDRE